MLEINADQSNYMDALPGLLKAGLLNPNYVTENRIRLAPTQLTTGFMLTTIPSFIQDTYRDDPRVDSCLFSVNVIDSDDYGNEQKTMFVKFSFNRKLFERINWAKFQAENIVKVAPGFSFNPALVAKISGENQAVKNAE